MNAANLIIRVAGIATVFAIGGWLLNAPVLVTGVVWAIVGVAFAVKTGAAKGLSLVEVAVGTVVGFVIMTFLIWLVDMALVAFLGAGPNG
jgi:hypothetical protein